MNNNLFLFYLHFPKCAGTTLLGYLRKHIEESEIYQSTSLIQNYWHNKYEYLFMPSPKEIRVYFGHWLHGEMLKNTDWRKPYLATSIREPINRFKSQYRYDAKIANEIGHEISSRECFIESNSNVYTKLLLSTFPALVNQNHEQRVDSCIKILQCFDFIYDSNESDVKIPVLSSRIGLDSKEIPVKLNTSDDIIIDIPFSDEEIIAANKDDLEIYRVFTESKMLMPQSDNPLYSQYSRDFLNEYLCTPYDENSVFNYLAPHLINEYLRYDVLNDFSRRLENILKKTKALN